MIALLVAALCTTYASPGVHLISDEEETFSPVSRMTLPELRAEWERVDAARPGLGGPIALMATGGAIAVVAGYVLLVGLIGAGAALFANPIGLLVACVTAAGFAMLVGGAAWMAQRKPLWSRYGDRLDEIRDRMEELGKWEGRFDEDDAPRVRPNNDAPRERPAPTPGLRTPLPPEPLPDVPPPPPPPPAAGWSAPAPTLVVAYF
jgi:hypothetical protein